MVWASVPLSFSSRYFLYKIKAVYASSMEDRGSPFGRSCQAVRRPRTLKRGTSCPEGSICGISYLLLRHIEVDMFEIVT